MSSHPAATTMAEAATEGATPLLPGLPDEIAVWEILVRLDPKSLLRCRAVRRAWRRATSTHDFLQAHHARQPALPLLYGESRVRGQDEFASSSDEDGDDDDGCPDRANCLDIIHFDRRADDQLQPVARFAHVCIRPEASRDGLLVISVLNRIYAVCNPATRQSARLRLPSYFRLLGMYNHSPTGQYRLLFYSSFGPGTRTGLPGYHVLSLVSGQRPRHIEWDAKELGLGNSSVQLRGCLHWIRWRPMQHGNESNMVMVFDTTAESFRLMRAPVIHHLIDHVDLFEMDDTLAMFSFNGEDMTIDIWMLQDYESEVWTFKCHIKLPVTEVRARCESLDNGEYWDVVVVPGDGELIVLVKLAGWLLQVDMDGKLVANFHRQCVWPTQFQLKQSLVPHSFFPTLKGYVVNEAPFL